MYCLLSQFKCCFAEQLYHFQKIKTTILNYDKENGFTFLNGFKKQIPEIGKDVENLFKKVPLNDRFSKLLPEIYHSNTFKNTDFKKFVDGLNATEKRTLTAGEALKNYNKHLQSVGKTTTVTAKVMSGLKQVGSVLASMGTAFLVSEGINLAIQGLDYLWNYQNNLIKKGEESRETIDEIFNSFDKGRSTISNLGKSFAENEENIKSTGDAINTLSNKYTELNKGVDSLSNKNKTLSTDEYQSYLDISNQLAEQFPSLVAGYDEQGNAILNLGNNATVAAQKINELYEAQMLSAHVDIGKEIDDTYEGVLAQVEKYKAENNSYKESIEIYEKQRNQAKSSGNIESFDNNSKYINDFKQRIQSNNNLIKEQYAILGEYSRKYLETSKEFAEVDSSLQSVLANNIGNLDYSILTEGYNGDFKNFLNSEIIIPLSNMKPEAQKALADALNIDDKSNTLFKFSANVHKALQDAFPNDIETQNKMKNLFGFDNIISEATDKSKELRSIFGNAVDNLSLDEINQGYDLIVNDKFTGTFDELKSEIEKAKALAATGIDLNVHTQMDEIEKAFESENKGSDYEKSLGYLEKAKELYDKGLVGTDDFKSVASYLSPTGADDPVNFAENYGKALRYITKDGSGVQNFLADLQSNGYATMETLSDGTTQWKYNIEDLEQASIDMGIGFEFMMDMFGRLEDYGASNNFVGSIEDGAARISEKSKELVEAEAELARLESTGNFETIDENGNIQHTLGDQTAIDQQREKVQALHNDIVETKNAMDQLVSRSADEYAEQVTQAKDTIAALAEQRKEILENKTYKEDTENVANMLEEQMQQIADEYGIELDSEFNIKVKADDEASSVIDDINKKELLDKHAKLTSEDDATGVINLWNSLSADPQITSLSAEDQATWVVEYWNSLTPEQQEAYIKGEITMTDSASDTVQYVDGEIGSLNTNPKITINAVDNANYVINSVRGNLNLLNGSTATTYIKTIKTTQTSNASSQGGLFGFGKATGTMLSPARASGTAYNVLNLKPAYSNGKVALPQDEKALVNELGTESIIRDGVWSLLPGGMHVQSLKKGDIVLSVSQTKSLMQTGMASGHGRAYANGTLSAYAGGSGGVSFGVGGSGSKGGWYGTSSGNSSTPASNSNSNSNSNSDSDKEFKEKIDEIEILLDRMESSLQRLTDSIETYSYDLSKQSEVSTQAMNQIRINLGTLQQAYNRYIQEANSVGLDESWKQKVQNGAVNIETIQNEDLKKSIDEYTKW